MFELMASLAWRLGRVGRRIDRAKNDLGYEVFLYL